MHLSVVCPRMGGGGAGGTNPQELDSVECTWVGNLTSWRSPGWEIWPRYHLGKWSTREWVIRSTPSYKIPSSYLDEFPTFWCDHFFVKDGRTKLTLSFWSFTTKTIFWFPQHWDAILAQSLISKICFLLICFHQMLPCHKFLMKWKIKKAYVKTWNSPRILC